MRKIKFRVWDGKLMHNVSELHFCMGPKLDGNGLKFYGPGVGQGWIDGENVHLMQYTGLKDKNGKEIYEGDILKVTTVRGDTRWQMEVDFENGCFALKEGPELWKLKYDYPNHEVIGNTYENPELLER
ncbi:MULTISPECIES: YopX family protein [Bacillus]|uniref:YopX family protein n=1 Tax=Bacillus TaxID=1386 RepID=UPI001E444458|nr:YopX family protein [Bacillus wiedmannii]MCC2381231.1 YopX family protein [Bacillus wiedmannii]MCC2425577.1 YopX family protein [Bacillus wiedmannii]MCU5094964.1 YopX family protein [Bacillus wiedmannii]